jgi:hypothetical protein
MPETYGLPEPEAIEPTVAEEAVRVGSEVVAGQGIVRTVLLYVICAALIVSPLPGLAVLPLIMLLASDKRLA